ncbi:MAG TPA: AMP-dependent synthetase/ligase [Candidatus Binatia bacterium]|nr:AMP-dependent synthetase/ligase [Candidatus Binatia bacterium]
MEPAALLLHRFRDLALRLARRPRYLERRDGRFAAIVWEEAWERALAGALALRDRGFRPGETVAFLAGTRAATLIAHWSVWIAGGVNVPIPPRARLADVEQIVDESEARWLFVDDEGAARAGDLAGRAWHASFGLTPAARGGDDWAAALAAALPTLRPRRRDLDREIDRVDGARLATITYTSGTTGTPKGAEHTHGGIAYSIRWQFETRPAAEGERDVNFLPFAHNFARFVDYFGVQWGTTTAISSFDGVFADVREIRPHMLFSVPRVFEKAYSAALAAGPAGAEERLRAIYGGRLRRANTGGATIAASVVELHHRAGIELLDAFGMSEVDGGVLTQSPPGAARPGTVGRAIRGIELRIADDGEVLARGPTVSNGRYFKRPAETAETWRDGWLHTGDLGEIDGDGYLRITGRKKDILKTAGGKAIAPLPIENALKRDPLVAQAVVVGDGRPYCVVLVQVDLAAAREWLAGQGALPGDDADLRRDPRVRDRIAATVAVVNAQLQRHETLKAFAVLPRDLSVDAGELTATAKVKRNAVVAAFAAEIDALYRDGGVAAAVVARRE